MNAPIKKIYTDESLMQPLRSRIDRIDLDILNSIGALLGIFEWHLLPRGMTDSFLLDTPQQYASIFRMIFTYIEQEVIQTKNHEPIDITNETSLVLLMRRVVNLAQVHSEIEQAIDENKVMELLRGISWYLDQRVKLVWEAWGWESYKSSIDAEKWIQSWWKNAEMIIPVIWSPIHEIAREIEEACKMQNYRHLLSNTTSCRESRSILKKLLGEFHERYIHWLRPYIEQWNTDIAERLSYLLTHTSEGSAVCDIWTYDGFFAHSLSENWRTVTAIDLLTALEPLFQAERRYHKNSQADIIISDFDALAIQSSSFDYTILSHILEHVPDMTPVMNEAIRISKTGWKIIVIVPDRLWNDPTHVRIVTEDDMRKISSSLHVVSWHQKVWNGWGYIFQK